MKLLHLIDTVLLVLTVVSCRFEAISHDEKMAAAAAVHFAETSFIRKDYGSGYSLLSTNLTSALSFEEFQKAAQRLHPTSFPTVIRAEEFEPVLGQKAIEIFLVGENSNEKFYYRLTMEGTAQTAYKVLGMYRGNGPYPPSNLRQTLKVE
jgi:hypothetical protein